MSSVVCHYCSHRNAGDVARCTHCGAPVAAPTSPPGPAADLELGSAPPMPDHGHGVGGATVAHLRRGAESMVRQGEAALHHGESAMHTVGTVERGLRTLTERKRYSPRHWLMVLGGLVILLVCGVVVAGRFSPPVSPFTATSASGRLPDPLHAATCRPYQAEAGEQCVLPAGDPLLRGLSAGRDLTFHVRTLPPGTVEATVERWRAAARAIVADGDVFAAVGPSATVLYADTGTGLALETGAFDGEHSARSFLERSGLLGQDDS
ncbi:hypothetical protein BOX37_26515 [Nocardia mangyaensis]|uniref:Uncharacterized protein n=1 Tax=Nocardia mangyaensis TaxID=2213200 RepID=A0A1J0VXT3_9NOCA|nr:hypothetical protein BOX37_26515 [Nocardia mangyaensis]